MRMFKKALVLTAMLGMFSTTAFAETSEGVEVTVTTDKEAYTKGEEVKFGVSVNNTNSYELADPSLVITLPEGLSVNGQSVVTYNFENIKANANQSEEVKATLDTSAPTAPETGSDNTVVPMLLFVAFGSAVCVLMIKNKKSRKATSVLLAVLVSIGVLGSVSAINAETVSKHINGELEITVDNAKNAIKYEFSYNVEKETTATEEDTTVGENKQVSKVTIQYYTKNETDNSLVKQEGFYELEEYDDNGNLVKYSQYMAGNLSVYTTYEYDENGNQTKATSFDANGSVTDEQYFEYECSADGKILKKTILDSEKKLTSAWTYNEEGYVTSLELADGNVYTYDTFTKTDLENGAYYLLSVTSNSDDFYSGVAREFDGLGNHITTAITAEETFYRHIYGEDGRLSAKEAVDNRAFPAYMEYQYEYK